MIADFLKKPLTDELIDRIAQQCTLKGMRENENSFKLSNEEQSSPLLIKKGRGGRMEDLFYSRAEWEIWKGSVGKTQRHRIEVWFWDLGEKCTSDSLLLRCTICKKACCWPIDVW